MLAERVEKIETYHILILKVEAYLCGVDQLNFFKNVGREGPESQITSKFIRKKIKHVFNWVKNSK